MAVNKVIYNGENGAETLVDLTGDSVTAQSLLRGATAHDRSGAAITGTADYSITSTATGADITLADAADGYVQSVAVKGHSEIVSGEIVSVGDNGLTVTTCGKNLFDKTDYTEYRIIKADGTLENRATYGVSGYIKCKPETQYYLTNVGGGSEVRSAYCYDKNENGLGACFVDGGSIASGAITTLANTAYIRICCAMTEVDSVQVEESATGTAYEAYKSTTAEITTGLPLRSASESVYDEIIGGNVITRCEVVSNEVVPKVTPVVTPLTAAEKAALAGLKTYNSTTHISATDAPVLTVEYFNNSDNGQAVANIDKEVAGKQDTLTFDSTPTANSSNPVTSAGIKTALDTKQAAITQSSTLTLLVASWDSTTKQQTVTFAHDTAKRNVIDITLGEEPTWAECGVYAISETAAGITFECDTIPESALTFKVTSMEVS